MGELIRRPELNYEELAELDEARPKLREDVQEQVNIEIKYEGYIQRQKRQVEQFKKLETKKSRKILIMMMCTACDWRQNRN